MLNKPYQECTYGSLDKVRDVGSGLSSNRYLHAESDALTHKLVI